MNAYFSDHDNETNHVFFFALSFFQESIEKEDDLFVIGNSNDVVFVARSLLNSFHYSDG